MGFSDSSDGKSKVLFSAYALGNSFSASCRLVFLRMLSAECLVSLRPVGRGAGSMYSFSMSFIFSSMLF